MTTSEFACEPDPTYEGNVLAADLDEGDGLRLSVDCTVANGPEAKLPCALAQGSPLRGEVTSELPGGRDIVVRYTGDGPDLAFTDPRRNQD